MSIRSSRFRSAPFFLLSISGALLLAACNEISLPPPVVPPPPVATTQVSGIVSTARAGEAVAGATVSAEGTTVTASVSFADREDGVGYTIVAALSGHFPGLDAADADVLMQKAHAVCPYSDLIGRSHQVALSVA